MLPRVAFHRDLTRRRLIASCCIFILAALLLWRIGVVHQEARRCSLADTVCALHCPLKTGRTTILVFTPAPTRADDAVASTIRTWSQASGRRSVSFFVVSADPAAASDLVRRCAHSNRFACPVQLDPGQEPARRLHVADVPGVVVLSAEGGALFNGALRDAAQGPGGFLTGR